MKRNLLLFIFALLSFALHADDNNHRMVVYFKNGEKVNFILKENPVVTFNDKNVRIKTNIYSIECLRSEIEDLRFEEINTNIEAIDYLGNGMITIFDASGRMVFSVNSNSSNSDKCLLESFSPGIYIIKFPNKQTIKLIKK